MCCIIERVGAVWEMSRLVVGKEERAASCSKRSEGDSRSSGVGAEEVFAVEGFVELFWLEKGAPRRRWVLSSEATSARERALPFLGKEGVFAAAAVLARDLKANFLGGLNEVRIFSSFSDSALMALLQRI